MNKSLFQKKCMLSMGNPFNKIDFNPERHAYLEGLKFAGKYLSTGERAFEMIVSKPYSQSSKEQRKSRVQTQAYRWQSLRHLSGS